MNSFFVSDYCFVFVTYECISKNHTIRVCTYKLKPQLLRGFKFQDVQNHTLKVGNKSLKNMEKFKYS